MRIQRRDVGICPLCNVATLPRTSRHCPILRPNTVHFALLTLYCHYMNPSIPVSPFHTKFCWNRFPSRRRSLVCPPTLSPTLAPQVSPIPTLLLHLCRTTHNTLGILTSVRVQSSTFGLGFHIMFILGWVSHI